MDERVPEVESFRKAPYYYGRVETVSGEIGILPVTNTIPLSQEYPATRCDALRPILNEMNTFLAQWKAVTFIDEIALPRRDVPEIYIDNVTDDLFYTMGKGPRSEMYLTRITPSLEWSKHLANKVAESLTLGMLSASICCAVVFSRTFTPPQRRQFRAGRGVVVAGRQPAACQGSQAACRSPWADCPSLVTFLVGWTTVSLETK